MSYFSKSHFDLVGFRKARNDKKMYEAILEPRTNKGKNDIYKDEKTGKMVRKPKGQIYLPFGSSKHENYQDKTGLNLYPHLIHGDEKRRQAYRARAKGKIKPGFWSPSYMSYYYLW